MAGAGKQYRYVGNHAVELQVGDALPWVGEGDFITLSDAEANSEKTRHLIDTGVLVDVAALTQQAAEAEVAAAEAEEQAAQEGAEAATEAATATATATTTSTKGGKS